MNIMESILQQMPGISQPQKKVFSHFIFHYFACLWQGQLHESQSL
jgi:hypothetical protein